MRGLVPFTVLALVFVSLMAAGSDRAYAAGPGSWIFPTAAITGTTSNCQAMQVSGQTLDANGNPVNNVQIRVRSTDGRYSFLSSPSAGNGAWGLSAATTPIQETWLAYVEASGQEQSPALTFSTNGSSQCAQGSGGVQFVTMNFSQQPAQGPPPPVNPPVNTSLLFPSQWIAAVQANCSSMTFSGQLLNASGGPVSGLALRVVNNGSGFSQLTALSDGNGNWSIQVAGSAQAGLWNIWVTDGVNQVSNVINVQTNDGSNCQPGSTGVQNVQMNFSQGNTQGGSNQPVSPPADPSLQYPTAFVTSASPNCGTTNISGVVTDINGNGLNGIQVVIQSSNQSFSSSFTTASGGNWAFNLGPSAVAGLWYVWIQTGTLRESNVVNVQTTGPSQCAPGSGGVQVVSMTFRHSN